jgi:hypothetical protein
MLLEKESESTRAQLQQLTGFCLYPKKDYGVNNSYVVDALSFSTHSWSKRSLGSFPVEVYMRELFVDTKRYWFNLGAP